MKFIIVDLYGDGQPGDLRLIEDTPANEEHIRHWDTFEDSQVFFSDYMKSKGVTIYETRVINLGPI